MSELWSSKKFKATCIGLLAVVLTFLLGKLGVHVPEEKVAEFLGLIAAFVVGQGIADHGKEAARLAHANGVPKLAVVDPTDKTRTTTT